MIEKYLVLNKYMLSLFGVNEFRDLQLKLRDVQEGTDNNNRSYFVNTLMALEGLKIKGDSLLKYDENIQSYTKKLNYKRRNVSLKYFQYLAVLFTEIFLDYLKNEKMVFLNELNSFLGGYKQELSIEIEPFTEDDLKKLAFWMATGSGKTLIMHINYYQFFKYNLFSPDNIILITPNEGLSKQHYEELNKSGIPCRLYSGSLNGGLRSDKEVLVIEITKFVEEKKGGGITLPVEAFEGKNLVFVDEGHKGKRLEEQKWAKLRNKLAENGFVFEYSATFGQILNRKNKETLEEYAKSIIFDYSYKYFYLDGYGKDFYVLNITQKAISDREFQEAMFVANLLSFYEQLLYYEENKDKAKEYNLEKPLWIFVGTTVTGKEEESDVIQIVEFIDRVIKDENWLKNLVEKILNGKTGLKDEDDKDVFNKKFEYLKSRGVNFDDLYLRVFGGRGGLKIYELKNAEGELGLKISENEYFGVINIGNVSQLKKQLERNGISVGQDAISGSLFDDIKKEGSKINILIGSKKFIEGWDTWRVSSMGLLNIGTGQGPQIIQLFGRGVRLKGKHMSLKRSGEVPYLETLNIYSIKADYLKRFLDAIRNEEVEFETIEIPVKHQHKEKWKDLYILAKPENKKFEEEKVLKLEIDNNIYFTIDLLLKISVYQATERSREGIRTDQISGESIELRFPQNFVDLLDWERIWQEVYEFKIAQGYWNLVLDKDMLKNLLLSDRYKIMAFPKLLEVKSIDDLQQLEDIALLIIKKYLDLFYNKHAKFFETNNFCYDKVNNMAEKLIPPHYTVQIDKRRTIQTASGKKDLATEIRNLVNDLEKLMKDDEETLPRVYFDSHLYVPILLQSRKIDRISPVGLIESERKFVVDLREYLKNNKDNKDKFADVELYLLRNYPFSGVGFQLQWSKFYPDFIMWVKKEGRQIIAFIDPKGLIHTKGLDDEKIQFAKEIKEIEQKLNKEDEQKSNKVDIYLESFILSATPYESLIRGKINPPSKDEYIKHNVLFLDDKDWPEILFEKIDCLFRTLL